MITKDVSDKVKSAADIVDVVSKYVSLRKKGVNFWGVCPFHDDSSPSMSVSPSKQIFKCFACGASGDSITFVMRHEGISYPEALKVMAKWYQIEIPEQSMTEDERRKMLQYEALRNCVRKVHSAFRSNLLTSDLAKKYLSDREISDEMIEKFQLGYAINANQLSSFPEKDLLQTLDYVRVSSGRRYDFFRDRVTFPFFDLNGNVSGFAGRILTSDTKFAKYLNSSNSDLYNKGKSVYGLLQARPSILAADKIYFVEGYTDVISFHAKGVENTVCGSGTALTVDQAKMMLRFSRNLTMVYDGDAAGQKACVHNLPILLEAGFNVRIIQLPEEEDPDSFARKLNSEQLRIQLHNAEKVWLDFFVEKDRAFFADMYQKTESRNRIVELVKLIPDISARNQFIGKICETYQCSPGDLKLGRSVSAEKWPEGIYGIEEAAELVKSGFAQTIEVTFNRVVFEEKFGNEAYVYVKGLPEKLAIHEFAIKHKVISVEIDFTLDVTIEPSSTLFLKELFKLGTVINLRRGESISGFLDWYVTGYSLCVSFATEMDRSEYIDRCAEMISYASATVRTVQHNQYAKSLGLTGTQLKTILAPFLGKRNSKEILDAQRVQNEDNFFEFNADEVPAYVLEDDVLNSIYMRYGFYPILNKAKEPVAYMFKHDKGSGHQCISDFYMIPLLHVYSKDALANKRVVQLNHMHLNAPKFVEWQSAIFSNLAKVNEKLIDEGAYNFEGSLIQWKKIWKNMSYDFIKCNELKVFGWQPEEFFAFSNAIVHIVDGVQTVDHVSPLGVVTHNGENYYIPAFSKIYAQDRAEADVYEQDRSFVYKDIPEDQRVSFENWSKLVNEVFKDRDNGKWAILMSILCAFRDFIFENKQFFTTLFFTGPTGSGKSAIAESLRALYMPPSASPFNLNTGTDAAFFLMLQRYRNVPIIMEEYNDNQISPTKFQGLKSAILDGTGKVKVMDMASKAMDFSKIYAVPVVLGQEAPQQDDGSLSNRCVICDVPYKPSGAYTEHETKIFDQLKDYENAGLTNVLMDVLSIRPVVKKHYFTLYAEELKKLKASVSVSVSNPEGLNRILNSVTLLLTLCRLIDTKTSLKLPFTYEEFYPLAVSKVLKQVEIISSTNKLSTYFNAISFQINQKQIVVNKELKISQPGKVTIKKSGTDTEEIDLMPADMKVLYLDFEAIYPLYVRAVGNQKEALSRQSLKSYFESNQAYIGSCRATKFRWHEEGFAKPATIDPAIDTQTMEVHRVLEVKTKTTSAYMFNYDMLKGLMNIDFERDDYQPNPDASATPDTIPF